MPNPVVDLPKFKSHQPVNVRHWNITLCNLGLVGLQTDYNNQNLKPEEEQSYANIVLNNFCPKQMHYSHLFWFCIATIFD